MICDACGHTGARVRRVTQSVGGGRSAFLIERVPIVSCRRCGESYLTAQTLHEVERIRLNWRQLCVYRNMAVARFGA